MKIKKTSPTSVFLLTLLVFSLIFASNARAIEVIVSDNGSGTASEVNTTITDESIVSQTNDVIVENNVSQEAETGENNANLNSGNTIIATGNIQTETDVENNVNTSSVSTGCCASANDFVISGNGTDSTNSISSNSTNNSLINTANSASINNTISINANTGNNTANFNQGEVTIKTGDISIETSVTNSANRDIVENNGGEMGRGDSLIINNGSISTNIVTSISKNNNTINLQNFANFNNNVGINATTGNNNAHLNNGNVKMVTGDVFIDVLINNFANLNQTATTCCGLGGNDPEDPVIEDTPHDPEVDEDKPDDNNDSDDDDDDNDDGEILPEAASTSIGGPNILGLSDTDSKAARALFFWIGLMMIVGGLKYIVQEISPKTIRVAANT